MTGAQRVLHLARSRRLGGDSYPCSAERATSVRLHVQQNTLADFGDGCSADDAPGNIDLSEPGDSLTLDLDGTTIDDVTWDAGWTLTNNVSLMLDTTHYDPDDDDDPASWCDGVDAYASGRLGSPGAESNCP
jgi:hypothetical protein